MGSGGSFSLKGLLSLDSSGYVQGTDNASKATIKLRNEIELATRAQARHESAAASAIASMSRETKGTDEYTAAVKRSAEENKKALALEEKIAGLHDKLALSAGSVSKATTGMAGSFGGAYSALQKFTYLIPGLGMAGLIGLVADLALGFIGMSAEAKKAAEAIGTANKSLVDQAEHLKALRREMALIGKTPLEKAAMGIGFTAQDEKEARDRLNSLLEDQRKAKKLASTDALVGGSLLNNSVFRAGARLLPESAVGKVVEAQDREASITNEIAIQDRILKGITTRRQEQVALLGQEKEKLADINGEYIRQDEDRKKANRDIATLAVAQLMSGRAQREGEFQGGLLTSRSSSEASAFNAIMKEAHQFEVSETMKELGLRGQMLDGEVGRTRQQRERIAIEKIHLQFAARMEEDRIKFMEEEVKLSKLIGEITNETLLSAALAEKDKVGEAFKKLRLSRAQDEAAEVAKIQAIEYNKALDSIRDAAGHVFDAMFQRGKSVFQSLADFFLSIFNTAARRVFQNIAEMAFSRGQSGVGILSGVFPGLSGGGGGFGGSSAASGIGRVEGALTSAFGPVTSGGLGSYGQMGTAGPTYGGVGFPAWTGAGGSSSGGFASTGAGAATGAGLTMGGGMLLGDAWKQGGARGILEGIGGGAAMGAGIGMFAGPIGAGIGAAIGAAAGLVIGIFGGGEKRRAQERQRRADIQSGYGFEGSTSQNLFSAAGGGMGADVETDFTGRLRALPKLGGVTIIFERDSIRNDFISGERAEEVAPSIIRVLNREMMQGSMSSAIAEATS